MVSYFEGAKNSGVICYVVRFFIFAGRFTFRDENVLSSLDQKRCLAIKYVDDDGKPTQTYPLNPNGSPRKLIW
jgi:Phosphoribosylformylglycinamidine (FGAM) synthase, glutamine amidotransferase domain